MSRTPFRMFADFTGADPRFRDPPVEEPDDCVEDAAPAWEDPDSEPLRTN